MIDLNSAPKPKGVRMIPYFRVLSLLLSFTLFFVACASTPKKTAEEDILATLALLGDAVAAKDINAIMELLSPTFHQAEIGDKNAAYTTMTLITESGYSGNFTLNNVEATTTLDEAKHGAIVAPVTVVGADKSYNVSISLLQNSTSGAWEISTFQILP